MKKSIIICVIAIIVIVVMLLFFTRIEQISKSTNDIPINYYINEKEENQKEQQKIQEISGEQGLEAEAQIYELSQEYDGREVLIVKTNIQFKVAMAGILQKDKPEYSNIDEILKKGPTHTGIWIEESSREKFLELLKEISKANYKISDEGFLILEEKAFMNNYDKKIKKMILSNFLYVFNINSISYIVDEVTGKIEEYPFEEMDPYQGYQDFESENKKIFTISENSRGKVSQKQVLNDILDYIN